QLGLSDTGTFPSTSGWACVSATCYGGWSVYTANAAVDAYLAPYLPTKPTDPSGGRGYGGYVFHNWGGASGFAAGYVMEYLLEPTGSTAGIGGTGKVYTTNAEYIACLLYLQ